MAAQRRRGQGNLPVDVVAATVSTASVARATAEIDLSVPPLAVLHTRRSMKWDRYPADVLSATVAEMDFPIAPPVAAALHAAIDRHDLGYAHARIRV